MCDFISWFEKDGTVIFLTDDDLATEAGKKLRAIGGMFPDDIKGHGAIRKFYELNEWVWPAGLTQKECTDFSSPNNFPPQIVEALKNCNLTQIGKLPENILLKHRLNLTKKDAKWEEAYAKREEADAKREEAYAKWEEAYAKWEEADAKWEEADANNFWKVFANPKNRKKAWR